MKPITFRKSLVTLACAASVSASGALKPEGDKIEFSPPREVLKVAPVTGSDLSGPTFNFQRRDPGASVSDVPAAVALPAPDQVNRMRALQEMIEQRNSWARPGDLDSERDTDLNSLNSRYLGSESELSIDDLFDRQSGKPGGGLSRDGDSSASPYGRNREREERFDGSSRDRRGMNNRNLDDRSRNQDRDARDRTGGERDPLIDGPLSVSESGADLLESGRYRRDGSGPSADPNERDRERRGASEGLFEFGSRDNKMGDFLRASTRENSDTPEHLDSLRRVLGGSANSILGTPNGTRSGFGAGAAGGGMFGMPGATPGGNRNLLQTLDSRPGAGGVVPAAEGPGTGDRMTSLPNRPLGLELTTGREGFSSRSERMQLTAPPPSPMELFRRKHDPRIPSRDF
ncbi:MAG: hypothetical protein AB7O66_06580 [Limisphaerales bacterium]